MNSRATGGEKQGTSRDSRLEIFRLSEDITVVSELIEISEEAYKKNHIYRPWRESEIADGENEDVEKKPGDESGHHAVTAVTAADLDAA